MTLFWSEGNCDLNGRIISHTVSCYNLLLSLIQFTIYLSIMYLLSAAILKYFKDISTLTYYA